ncbi:hypothetical protein, partial [Bacillus cereus]|uniref:hypothetical protein n=1 Tax=Bacillus cereus TaxID=1396 RepID=UPI0034D46F7B
MDCNRPAPIHADGKDWCKIHSPEAVAKRRARSDAKYAAEQAKSAARYATLNRRNKMADAYPAIYEALRAIVE